MQKAASRGRARKRSPGREGARLARQNAWSEWFREQLDEDHRDLTQEAAARELGVPLATFSRWCRGYSEPTADHLFAIIRTWGVLPDLEHLATLEYPGGRSRLLTLAPQGVPV